MKKSELFHISPLHDIDPVKILMDDHCTEKEARECVANHTATIFSPEEYVEDVVAQGLLDEELEYFGIESKEDLLALANQGKLSGDGISSGIYFDHDDERNYPYVIVYCL